MSKRPGSVEEKDFEQKRNREINAAQVPSDTEHVSVPAIWVFEVLTPSTAENLAAAVERLGWDQEDERHLNAGFVQSVARLRRSAYGGSWMNLGWIVPPTPDNVAWSHNRVAALPDGVRSVSAHIVQFTPSVTVLAFQFMLRDEASFSVDEALREL